MTKGYSGLAKWVKLVLQFFFGWPIAVIYRIAKGIESSDTKVLIFGILAIPFGVIFWIIDFITTILSNEISVLA